MASKISAVASIKDAQFGWRSVGFEREEKGYLLFVGRTRRMTQYADTAVSDIDPDGTLRVCLSAQVIERSS